MQSAVVCRPKSTPGPVWRAARMMAHVPLPTMAKDPGRRRAVSAASFCEWTAASSAKRTRLGVCCQKAIRANHHDLFIWWLAATEHPEALAGRRGISGPGPFVFCASTLWSHGRLRSLLTSTCVAPHHHISACAASAKTLSDETGRLQKGGRRHRLTRPVCGSSEQGQTLSVQYASCHRHAPEEETPIEDARCWHIGLKCSIKGGLPMPTPASTACIGAEEDLEQGNAKLYVQCLQPWRSVAIQSSVNNRCFFLAFHHSGTTASDGQ